MIHPSLLPPFVQILCLFCYQNNTEQFGCLLRTSTTSTRAEKLTCKGAPPFPFPIPEVVNETIRYKLWFGPHGECTENSTLKGTSNCAPTEISWNSIKSNCTGPIGRPHTYQCVPESSNGFLFYPTTPDFESYSVTMVFVATCIICCILIVLLNVLNMFIFIKSKSLRSSKTIIFALHMAVIDILAGTILLPLYIAYVYNHNYYLFKGERKLSENTLERIDTWFNRLDLLILIGSFMNLAFMSLERCIVVVKPFWHMQNITMKKLLISIPVIWIYVLVGYFMSQYAFRNLWFNFAVGFIIPTGIMLLSYSYIIYSIGKPANAVSDDDDAMLRKRITERKVTVNLLMLIVVFLLCWIPYFVLLLGYHKEFETKHDDVSFKSAFRWMKLLSFCHCIFDPILYSFSRPNVRKEVKKIIKGEKDKSKSSFGLHSRSRVGTLHSAID